MQYKAPSRIIAPESAVVGEAQRLYLPALDGLRFFAFLLVLIHHVPGAPAIISTLEARGWVGVELFFAISSFLFFTLLDAEDRARGSINIPHFFVRRLLRLYPLMVAFPLFMLLSEGPLGWPAFGRFLGIAFFADNAITATTAAYNNISQAGHLWTLSYEFQIYLLIPVAFLIRKAMGRRAFAWALLAAWLICAGARLAFLLSGTTYLAIWVTPFLRPESTLLGIALSLGLFDRWRLSIMVTIWALALIVFLALPNIFQAGAGTMALYPAAAILCCAVLWLAVRPGPFGRLLSAPWLTYLGKISFGLYVFHLFGIDLAGRITDALGMAQGPESYFLRFAIAFGLTTAMATASYFGFERWFLLRKKRFTAIESRPI
jgi:peptidoglycan/LPS O-acetylase OafA/YrhL